MTALIIAAAALIGVACVAGLALLSYLLHRDRGQLWHPGDPLPNVPPDTPIRQLAARIEGRKQAAQLVRVTRLSP